MNQQSDFSGNTILSFHKRNMGQSLGKLRFWSNGGDILCRQHFSLRCSVFCIVMKFFTFNGVMSSWRSWIQVSDTLFSSFLSGKHIKMVVSELCSFVCFHSSACSSGDASCCGGSHDSGCEIKVEDDGTWSATPAYIAPAGVAALLYSPAHSHGLTRRERVRRALLRWHPDKAGRVLACVCEEGGERRRVKEGVEAVVRSLNELKSRESQ
jgi:hypothetical protein